MIRRTLAIATAALAAAVAVPATASTLFIYDYATPLNGDPRNDPYLDQTIERLAKSGLLQPVRVDVADDGTTRTQRVRILDTVIPGPLPFGVRIQAGSITWSITTQLQGSRLTYSVDMVRRSAMVDGLRPPSDRTENATLVRGTGDATGHPAFVAPYTSPAGPHVLVGYVVR